MLELWKFENVYRSIYILFGGKHIYIYIYMRWVQVTHSITLELHLFYTIDFY